MTVRVHKPASETGPLRAQAARPKAAAPAPAAAPASAPRKSDQNHAQTGKLQAVQAIDIEAVDLHVGAQSGKDASVIVEASLQRAASAAEHAAAGATTAASAASKATRGLGAAGVLTAMTLLVKAVNAKPVSAAAVVSALSDLAANLGTAAAGLSKIPGLDKALHVFGGIGGIVGGITGLVANFQDAQKKGLSTSNMLGLMGSACSLVGGLAMALTPFCPPLGVAATAFTLAGAAFNVAKLAVDHQDWIKQKAQRAASATTGALSTVADTAKKALLAPLASFERLVAWAP
ncbi:hypothetical protein D3C72_1080820 [compost metagenome]